MPFNQSEPDPGDVQKWFLDDPKVPDETFELALVLGGTVSAGAYTAGALDFLIEALDCWEAARAGGDPLVFYGWGKRIGLPVEQVKNYTALKDRLVQRPAVKKVLEREQSVLLQS